MKIEIYIPGFDGNPKDGTTKLMDINVNNVVTVSEDKEWGFKTFAEVKLIRGTYLITKKSADAIRDAI